MHQHSTHPPKPESEGRSQEVGAINLAMRDLRAALHKLDAATIDNPAMHDAVATLFRRHYAFQAAVAYAIAGRVRDGETPSRPPYKPAIVRAIREAVLADHDIRFLPVENLINTILDRLASPSIRRDLYAWIGELEAEALDELAGPVLTARRHAR